MFTFTTSLMKSWKYLRTKDRKNQVCMLPMKHKTVWTYCTVVNRGLRSKYPAFWDQTRRTTCEVWTVSFTDPSASCSHGPCMEVFRFSNKSTVEVNNTFCPALRINCLYLQTEDNGCCFAIIQAPRANWYAEVAALNICRFSKEWKITGTVLTFLVGPEEKYLSTFVFTILLQQNEKKTETNHSFLKSHTLWLSHFRSCNISRPSQRFASPQFRWVDFLFCSFVLRSSASKMYGRTVAR